MPASVAPAAIAAATRFLSKRAQARTLSGVMKSTTSMRTGPSVCVCRMKRPSNFRAEQHAEHNRLAKQLGDRLRIVVALQDRVDRGTETHHAAAQIEGGHLER